MLMRVRVLGGLAGVLIAAFLFAPLMLAGGATTRFRGEAQIADRFRHDFAGYWQAGDARFSPALADLVDYWFRYHLVKLVTAAALTVVPIVLAVRLRRAAPRVVVVALAVVSAAAVAANIQGMVAPFASLLSMGPDASTVEQVGQQLTAGTVTPPLQVMIDDFAAYHVALAMVAVMMAVTMAGVTTIRWRRSTRAGRAFFAVMTAAVLVVLAANVSVALAPVQGLQNLYA